MTQSLERVEERARNSVYSMFCATACAITRLLQITPRKKKLGWVVACIVPNFTEHTSGLSACLSQESESDYANFQYSNASLDVALTHRLAAWSAS